MNLGTTIPQFLTVGIIAQMVRAVSMAILRNFLLNSRPSS